MKHWIRNKRLTANGYRDVCIVRNDQNDCVLYANHSTGVVCEPLGVFTDIKLAIHHAVKFLLAP